MSNAYHLIDVKQAQNEKLTLELTIIAQSKLTSEAVGKSEEEISNFIEKFLVDLTNFFNSEVLLCTTYNQGIAFNKSQQYANIEELQKYFEANVGNVFVRDEYGTECHNWGEFVDRIGIHASDNIRWYNP